MRYPYEKDYPEGVEVCYWRKCWGLRNWFLRTAYPNYDDEQCYFKMTEKEIIILWRIVIHYLRNPDDWNDSIWTYDEIRKTLYDQRWNLTLLRVWITRHPDAEVYFYDSY